MMILYTIVYFLFVVVYFPVLVLRRKFHKGIIQRLGIFTPAIVRRLAGKKHIWIHAVSVGEAMTAGRLLSALRHEHPQYSFVISTVTTTGNAIARSFASDKDTVIYFPLDFDWIIRKALRLIQPAAFIAMETELWPKLINRLHKDNIPVVIVNGRLSQKSFNGYQRLKPLVRSILAKIALFCMQASQDARRIITLGAAEGRVTITGNMKFDFEATASRLSATELGLSDSDIVLVAGSTHDNEEEILLGVYADLAKEFSQLKLVFAPRHINRVAAIDRLIRQYGFEPQHISRRDKQTADNQKCVYVLDTMGQLQSLYRLAMIVFVGGSLIKKGGHNIIEPALFAKPIIFGPYMHNFQDVAEIFLEAQAARQVFSAAQLRDVMHELIVNADERRALGSRAEEIVVRNRGAVSKTVAFLKEFLK